MPKLIRTASYHALLATSLALTVGNLGAQSRRCAGRSNISARPWRAMPTTRAHLGLAVRELTPYFDHPRLGPLIRQLTLWATRPQVATSPA